MVHFIPQESRKLIFEWAQNDAQSICLLGQAGSGKSAIARWIHAHSPRSLQPFTQYAPASDLFTALEANPQGTIYIEEVAQLPMTQQKRLLTFVKTKTLSPLAPYGQPSAPARIFPARIIAASDESLERRVLGGLFSEELKDWLVRHSLKMPSLSERKNDFDVLVLGLVHELAIEVGKPEVRNVDDEAMELLKNYPWPGNLRELRNVLMYGIAHADTAIIDVSNLPDLKSMGDQFQASRSAFETWLAAQGIVKPT